MLWKARQFEWDLSHRCLIMGILNVTPDSFSDGGSYLDAEAALVQARRLVAEGADIIDVGGESTRPGAQPVTEAEECRRVLPAIDALVKEYPQVALSIDTSKAGVARAATEAGAAIVNDVTGLTGDAEMAAVAAESKAGLVLMHMQGEPRTMQSAPHYTDVVGEVRAFLECQGRVATEAGVAQECLAFDPGIGFGKGLEHNLQLLNRLDAFQCFDQPVLLGVSRKSFMGKLLGTDAIEARQWPTVALTSHAVEQGVRIIRVHDVLPNAQAARMTEAILQAS